MCDYQFLNYKLILQTELQLRNLKGYYDVLVASLKAMYEFYVLGEIMANLSSS
jgi:hypothetical protein